MSEGYIYLASNNVGGINSINYLAEAFYSAKSVKKVDPLAQITLFTDQEIENKDKVFTNIKVVKMSLRCKQEILLLSPYEKTILLDTDTYVNQSIRDLFQLLDKYEILGVSDYSRKRILDIKEYMEIPYGFSEINGGMLAFKKCDNLTLLYNLWNSYYQKYKNITPWDQPTLRISLWESNINLYVLPIEYNRRGLHTKEKCVQLKKKGDPRFGEDHLKTRVFHYHGLNKLNPKGKEKMAQFF